MMGMPKHSRVTRSFEPFKPEWLEQLEDAAERDLVSTVSAYVDTASIVVEDADTGNIAAYAVFGPDDDGIVTVYAGRCIVTGLGPMMFKQLFGAAKILGKPIRVHTERIKLMAKAIGATDYVEAVDTDGRKQVIAYG